MRRKFRVTMALSLSLVVLATMGCGKGKKSTNDETTANGETPTKEEVVVQMGDDLKLDDYKLVWSDEFDGDKLNEKDWNIEVHEKGWVNNELQEYVVSDENIYLKDGKLVIKPVIAGTNEDGSLKYTSGRISTQNKQDFTYGVFEARIKFPKGQGFLPAFWLMATDENVYGQWPRCGEIDIAEVLGHQTNKTYGTIHYGNPHNESQGTYVLKEGDFSEEFHTYAVEWLPGKMNWYVDGYLMHTESDWYSKTVGVGEITYPAPFDQPFYIILNLAVGGNWPGNPDVTTDFKTADMQVDYVKVYQKESYDENVKKPEKAPVKYRDPDETGNYIVNADFSEAENLHDEKDWFFYSASGGKGDARIENNTLIVEMSASGDQDYSIQICQPNIPVLQTGKYKVSFDAWADADRTMKTAVTAPNAGWIRYLEDTELKLTTEKQSYEFTFEVTVESDPRARFEFNMGNTDSTATIYAQNVRVEMIEGPGSDSSPVKSVLADGNYVYNGRFQEGEAHLGSWEIEKSDKATVEVTPFSDSRRLHVVSDADAADVTIAQKDLALSKGVTYRLTFDAEVKEDTTFKALVGGKEITVSLKKGKNSYNDVFELDANATNGKDFVLYLGDVKDILLDNVRIVEDVMIKNGSFSASFTGYEVYVDSSAKASHVVDSLNEDNAADFTIDSTGDADWKVQLKQNNVELKKGQKYKLSVDAKSSINRQIRVIMQAPESRNYIVYSGENTIDLTSEFKTYELEFEMMEDTDPEAFLSICMGAVEGNEINEQHRVVIDNISLVEID